MSTQLVRLELAGVIQTGTTLITRVGSLCFYLCLNRICVISCRGRGGDSSSSIVNSLVMVQQGEMAKHKTAYFTFKLGCVGSCSQRHLIDQGIVVGEWLSHIKPIAAFVILGDGTQAGSRGGVVGLFL